MSVNKFFLLMIGSMCIGRIISELTLDRISSSESRKHESKKPMKIRRPHQEVERLNVDKLFWDYETYIGRSLHFAFIADIRTIFVYKTKQVVEE